MCWTYLFPPSLGVCRSRVKYAIPLIIQRWPSNGHRFTFPLWESEQFHQGGFWEHNHHPSRWSRWVGLVLLSFTEFPEYLRPPKKKGIFKLTTTHKTNAKRKTKKNERLFLQVHPEFSNKVESHRSHSFSSQDIKFCRFWRCLHVTKRPLTRLTFTSTSPLSRNGIFVLVQRCWAPWVRTNAFRRWINTCFMLCSLVEYFFHK